MIEISFILTQSAGSFQGVYLRNCKDVKRDMIFHQWSWWKENGRNDKPQRGIYFTTVIINTCFSWPKQSMKVIYYFCLVSSCHQPAQKSTSRLHQIWKYMETYWKKILSTSWVVLLFFFFFMMEYRSQNHRMIWVESDLKDHRYWVPAVTSSAINLT